MHRKSLMLQGRASGCLALTFSTSKENKSEQILGPTIRAVPSPQIIKIRTCLSIGKKIILPTSTGLALIWSDFLKRSAAENYRAKSGGRYKSYAHPIHFFSAWDSPEFQNRTPPANHKSPHTHGVNRITLIGYSNPNTCLRSLSISTRSRASRSTSVSVLKRNPNILADGSLASHLVSQCVHL